MCVLLLLLLKSVVKCMHACVCAFCLVKYNRNWLKSPLLITFYWLLSKLVDIVTKIKELVKQRAKNNNQQKRKREKQKKNVKQNPHKNNTLFENKHLIRLLYTPANSNRLKTVTTYSLTFVCVCMYAYTIQTVLQQLKFYNVPRFFSFFFFAFLQSRLGFNWLI